MLTKADGKLDLIFELPVFKKFHLKYAIEKENYLTIDNEYDLEVDLNNKVDSIRKDLGTIKLMQSLGQLTVFWFPILDLWHCYRRHQGSTIR